MLFQKHPEVAKYTLKHSRSVSRLLKGVKITFSDVLVVIRILIG
jgi:hypothetical protein